MSEIRLKFGDVQGARPVPSFATYRAVHTVILGQDTVIGEIGAMRKELNSEERYVFEYGSEDFGNMAEELGCEVEDAQTVLAIADEEAYEESPEAVMEIVRKHMAAELGLDVKIEVGSISD